MIATRNPRPWTKRVCSSSVSSLCGSSIAPFLLANQSLLVPNTEQERLIKRLAEENAARDASFANFLLALPIVTALPYLPCLLQPRTGLLAILSITSLLSTAFLLRRLPPTVTGIYFLDELSSNKNKAVRTTIRQPDPVRSPLEAYLPYLNLGLVVVLVLLGLVARTGPANFGFIGIGNVPALVYAAVLTAKLVMASVDPESELGVLKYDYKGA
jgi:hypothetical protein